MNKKTGKKIALTAVIVIVFFVYVYFSSSRLIIDAGGENFQSIISNCSYYAVENCINEKFDFSSVCTVERNTDGDITFIKTDALLVNYLSKKLALDCYEFVDEFLSVGIDIPVGVFTGVRLFSGIGPKVNVKLITVLSVECVILREFQSVGINQTRQVLSAVIHTDIIVYTLFNKDQYAGDIEITVYDNLIVGKVPETYLNSQIIAGNIK